MADLLCWTDIETTDLDPETGAILEFAAILTDTQFAELARFHCFLARDGHAAEACRRMPQIARAMHEQSGLWKDYLSDKRTNLKLVDNAINKTFGRPTTAQLDQILCGWIDDAKDFYNIDPSPDEPLDRVVLAGAGVSHMEDKWYEHYFPNFFSRFHYRAADISVVRSTIDTLLSSRYPAIKESVLFNLSTKDEIAHRAMDDTEQSIANAKQLVANLVKTI
jgi:oligoribonuclease (3'-5' exoribonuclease)